MASAISSDVMPLDSRKDTFFANGADWTLGSAKKDTADFIRSSRMAVAEVYVWGKKKEEEVCADRAQIQSHAG